MVPRLVNWHIFAISFCLIHLEYNTSDEIDSTCSSTKGYGVALARVAANRELPFGLRQISFMLEYTVFSMAFSYVLFHK